jgi:hypothetical protein
VSVQCPGGFKALIDDIISHPAYRVNGRQTLFSRNDIAVGKLDTDLSIKPAHMSTKPKAKHYSEMLHYCAFAGYGEGDDGKTGRLNVIAANHGSMRMDKDGENFRILSSPLGQIVPGDSGGPVFCRHSPESEPVILAVNSYLFAQKLGTSNSVNQNLPWIRAVIDNWESNSRDHDPEAIENHMVHQSRISECAAKTAVKSPSTVEDLAKTAVAECAYVLTRAQESGMSKTAMLRAMMNGVHESDRRRNPAPEKAENTELPLEWKSFADVLAASLKKTGF